jgi:hypothetical protein
MTFDDLLHRVQSEFDEASQNLAWGLKLTSQSGIVRQDATNAVRHEDRPSGVPSEAGYRLQGNTTSQTTPSTPGRNGTHSPVEGAFIKSLGSIKVAIKDGYVVSAVDPDGSKWSAADLQKVSRPAYRRLTHGLVLMAALVPISITMASAHQSAQTQQRLVLNANPVDQPELSTAIPAAPTPSPSPSPSASPSAAPPAPKHAAAAAPAGPVTVAPSQQAVADIIRAAAAKWGADPNQLIRVAMCESHLNPNSHNPAGYYGLFQFNPNTFKAHGGTNIWDATDQANVAAHMFAQGLSGEWSCK